MGIDMRYKSIAITLLVLTSLVAVCMAQGYALELSQMTMKPLFDMSTQSWSPNTYPAFSGTGSSTLLYNAQTPTLPSTSGTDLGKISDVSYSPIFDMSPNAWTFNSYPTFNSQSGSTGLLDKLFG